LQNARHKAPPKRTADFGKTKTMLLVLPTNAKKETKKHEKQTLV